MTGTPNVSRLSCGRALLTPEPGEIPPVLSWMVHPKRPRLRAARASTAITAEGRNSRANAVRSSLVSTPVHPNTPVLTTATGRRPSNPVMRAISPVDVPRCQYLLGGLWAQGVRGDRPGADGPLTSTSPVSGSRALSSCR